MNIEDHSWQKTHDILRELVGDRVDQVEGLRSRSRSPGAVAIADALKAKYPPKVGSDIAFHMSDWRSDAAFIVVAHLFPERFTREEIVEGVVNLIVHAPNHMAAAAKLAGHPVEDIFGVDALSGDTEED